MAAHNSLPGLQQPETGSYPESIYFFKIYFNAIFRVLQDGTKFSNSLNKF
jgi:hypothetical protein